MRAGSDTLPVRVARKREEALDICSLELVAPGSRELPAFSAGSHLDLHLPGRLVRQHSLCGDPVLTRCYRLAVVREPNSRGGSVVMPWCRRTCSASLWETACASPAP